MTKKNTNDDKLKLNYPQIFIIGLGSLVSILVWSVYNAQVPLILNERFLLSNTVIGVIMTIDNFFGVIFQPLIGVWSDHTRTRIGRRMPWIIVGLLLCALFFPIIPLQQTLSTFMAVIIVFNLLMSLWRSPIVSLMPDLTPSPFRSEASGILNLMGGLGAIIAFFFGGILSDIGDNKFFAFLMASVLMIIVLLILLVFIREPDALKYRKENNLPIHRSITNRWSQESQQQLAYYSALNPEEKKQNNQGSITALLALPKACRKSLIAILIAIFYWFLGFSAIETFFTLYATHTYNFTGGQASMMLAGFSVAFLVSAIPAGLLGRHIGRKKTILIGLIGIIAAFIPLLSLPSQWLVQALLMIAGGFWAFVNINSLPMVLEFSTEQTIGAFTGYYYLFSFTSAIISPIIYGYIQDFFDTDELLFAFSLTCFVLALISMLFVNHGEYRNKPVMEVMNKVQK